MKRILFVDDEPRVLEGLEDLLSSRRSEWDMVFVTSGDAALGELARRDFDVVVSDMRMPGMDGATLLAKVRDRKPQVVRIVLSGFAESEAMLRLASIAHQFLTKPTSAAKMASVLERACGLHTLINTDRIREVVANIEKLPSLPSVYATLQEATSNERSSAADLARIIETDVAMCAKVLQLANSAFFGRGHRISSIEGATAYLGVNTLRSLVLSVTVFEPWRKAALRGLSLQELQTRGLQVSTLASQILCHDRRQAEDAFTAGMLHDVGKLVLALGAPEQLEAALAKADSASVPFHVAEQELFGVTHAEVGAYLLGLWGLPPAVVEAVARHHCPSNLAPRGLDVVTAVHVASTLVERYAEPARFPPPALDLSHLEPSGLLDRLPAWTELAVAQKQALENPAPSRQRSLR